MVLDTPIQPSTSKPTKVPLFKQKVAKLDVEIDNEVHYEFGGPIGVVAMMIGFPCLMYYFWVCLEYHQGQLIYPPSLTSLTELKAWCVFDIWEKVKQGAWPSMWAINVYMGYVMFSFVLAYVMPGPVVEGLPILSLNGQRVSSSPLR